MEQKHASHFCWFCPSKYNVLYSGKQSSEESDNSIVLQGG